MDKRSFLKTISLSPLAFLPFSSSLEKALKHAEGKSALDLASDEDFWEKIRGDYRLKPDYINLENGYYCFMPQPTLERYIEKLREVNYQGSWYMRKEQQANRRKMATLLADFIGAEADEVGITRNTTESLDLIIGGYPWKAGDEAIMAKQDYGSMLAMFRQVADRHGVVNKIVSVPNHPSSDEELVDVYRQAITPRTKLIMVCHMINITGQILPIRKICDMAHDRGVEVMVDGAHAVAHIDFDIKDLRCDYYGASLHKWLSVPLGSGLLYIRKGAQAQLWPLLAPFSYPSPDGFITRLNHLGTHPVHTELALEDAIAYHNLIGSKRKEERLRYLQRYWSDQARDVPGIVVNTPQEPNRSCGIANVGIEGMSPSEMAETLYEKYNIWTVAINSEEVKGCRITPNVYTSIEELDAFVRALKAMAG
jgi:selenocysteine lyase/cysteine desulfurase